MAYKTKRRPINKAAFVKMNANMYSKTFQEQEDKRKEKPFEIELKFVTKTFIKRCLPELAEAKKIIDVKLKGRTTVRGIEIDEVFVGSIPLHNSLNGRDWEDINKRANKYYEPTK